jgi:pyruvate dehydrogenase E2 component (dihydrolipoamide acetyltransferase)
LNVAKDVIMPALGMAQETGTLLQWLKASGDSIVKGEPLMEVETDKTTVEVEAPASGILANVTAQPGDVIPVGQTIAVILAPGEAAPKTEVTPAAVSTTPISQTAPATIQATPIARRIAAEHQLDLAQVKPQGGRVQKEDVLSYLATQEKPVASGRALASPKARRLANERGIEIKIIPGSGPQGAVLAADVLAFTPVSAAPLIADDDAEPTVTGIMPAQQTMAVSRMWRVMADRLAQAWTTIPHFYLLREVNATHLAAWLNEARERSTEKITYTDLLVKLTAAALQQHPRLNASWLNDTIALNADINVGLAVAVEDGLVVPVIHHADTLGLAQLAARRAELVTRAQAGKLVLDDLSGGTFTISNLGMYGVDAFIAIVNPPQAAILAVSRIAERVVPLNGQPAIQPMISLSLSCDHRVVDGARGAQFLQTLAELIENPMRLLD